MNPNPKQVSESELRKEVVAFLRERGWRMMFIRWDYRGRQYIKGDPGFPDITAVREGVLLFAELKRESEKPEGDQLIWLAQLGAVDSVNSYVWRPSDWLSGKIQAAFG